jgi:PAS domain S-box-containing protein
MRRRFRVRSGIAESIGLAVVLAGVVAAWIFERRQRRRAQSTVREHESQRAIAAEAPVMIWRSRVDKGCDFFNPWWLAFTGRTLDQELGTGWAEGVHPEDLEACLASYGAAFDAREPFRLEYRLRRFDGEYRWVLDLGTPRYDSTKQFTGYIGCCFDITDRKQAEQALGEAHEEINRVSRLTALGEFAAALSHELRQPLTAMILNARTSLYQLEKLPLDREAVKEALDDLLDAGHRAEAVIQRNRELFRHHRVQTSALDINAVVREVLVLSATRLQEHHVSVTTELADELPCVRGDRIGLLQVLLNLLANAIDAMESVEWPARRITVTTSRFDQGAVVVAVKDCGAGLDAVDMQRMFTLSYTTKATGTGVGLSISRSIMQAHGGRIWASQNADRGATFSLSLPVC